MKLKLKCISLKNRIRIFLLIFLLAIGLPLCMTSNAWATTDSAEIWVGYFGDTYIHLADVSQAEMEELECGEWTYTSIDNGWFTRYNLAYGVTMTSLMEYVNINPSGINWIYFTGTDEYSGQRGNTGFYNLFGVPHYYYPYLAENWNQEDPDQSNISVILSKYYEVPAILAFQQSSTRDSGAFDYDKYKSKMGPDKCLRIVFGQIAWNDVDTADSVYEVYRITVSLEGSPIKASNWETKVGSSESLENLYTVDSGFEELNDLIRSGIKITTDSPDKIRINSDGTITAIGTGTARIMIEYLDGDNGDNGAFSNQIVVSITEDPDSDPEPGEPGGGTDPEPDSEPEPDPEPEPEPEPEAEPEPEPEPTPTPTPDEPEDGGSGSEPEDEPTPDEPESNPDTGGTGTGGGSGSGGDSSGTGGTTDGTGTRSDEGDAGTGGGSDSGNVDSGSGNSGSGGEQTGSGSGGTTPSTEDEGARTEGGSSGEDASGGGSSATEEGGSSSAGGGESAESAGAAQPSAEQSGSGSDTSAEERAANEAALKSVEGFVDDLMEQTEADPDIVSGSAVREALESYLEDLMEQTEDSALTEEIEAIIQQISELAGQLEDATDSEEIEAILEQIEDYLEEVLGEDTQVVLATEEPVDDSVSDGEDDSKAVYLSVGNTSGGNTSGGATSSGGSMSSGNTAGGSGGKVLEIEPLPVYYYVILTAVVAALFVFGYMYRGLRFRREIR